MKRLWRLKNLAFCMDRRLLAPFEIEIEGTLYKKIIDCSQFVHYPDSKNALSLNILYQKIRFFSLKHSV
jgi:hypothetical protein